MKTDKIIGIIIASQCALGAIIVGFLCALGKVPGERACGFICMSVLIVFLLVINGWMFGGKDDEDREGKVLPRLETRTDYHPNGMPARVYFWSASDKAMVGPMARWHDNGHLKRSAYYSCGLPVDRMREWDINDNLIGDVTDDHYGLVVREERFLAPDAKGSSIVDEAAIRTSTKERGRTKKGRVKCR
jgi:hypothetical protein